MATQHITLLAKAHAGTITVHTNIPVDDETDTYIVNIEVAPQPRPAADTLDRLYGALRDDPLPEFTDGPLPEERDEV
jgi:hypothetical protein